MNDFRFQLFENPIHIMTILKVVVTTSDADDPRKDRTKRRNGDRNDEVVKRIIYTLSCGS